MKRLAYLANARFLVTASILLLLSQSQFFVVVKGNDDLLESSKPIVDEKGKLVLPTPSPSPSPATLSVEPKEIPRGSDRTLLITIGNCENNKWGDEDKVISDPAALADKGIVVTQPKVTDTERCTFSADLRATEAAGFSPVIITVNYQQGDQTKQGFVRIVVVKVEALPPGPIPPGLRPQVDVMWGVVPQRIVKDNFGTRVGKLFYCVEVVIGNNTGYDLQIASAGFKLGPVGDAAKYMAQRLRDASGEIANSPAITDLISASKIATARVEQAARDKASAEIQRLVMAAADAKQKDKEAALYQKLKTRADQSEALAQEAERVATAKKATAVGLVNARISVVRNEADQLTQLSRIAYAQSVPVGSYMMTRGSLEHGQIWSTRNIIMNSLRAFGPFLTGFTPYFHVINHRTNYSEAINIISNPLEKGFEAVVPDETIDQLQRLDEQILRDGIIIPNNRQIRTRVFIPKDVLRLDKDSNGNDIRDNPLIVTLALGEIQLIGNEIEYLNRVSVTSGPSGEVLPPPTVSPDSYRKEFELNGNAPFNFQLIGTNLSNAVLSTDDPNMTVAQITTTNTTLTAQLTIGDATRLGQHTLNVTNPRSSVPILITVKQPLLQLKAKAVAFSDDNKPIAFAADDKTFGPFTIEGRFLQGARLQPIGNNPIVASVTGARNDGTSFTARFMVPKGTGPGNYKFGVGNTEHDPETGDDRAITVTVGDRPKPNITGVAYGDDGTARKPKVSPATDFQITVILNGTNLNFVSDNKPLKQKSDETPQFKVESVESVSPTQLRLRLTVPKEAQAGAYHFTITNKEKATSNEFLIELDPQPAVTIDNAEQNVTAENDKPFTLTLNGKDLDKAEVTEKNPTDWASSVKSNTGTQLILEITPKGLVAGTEKQFTFNVVNTDTQHPKQVKLKVSLKSP